MMYYRVQIYGQDVCAHVTVLQRKGVRILSETTVCKLIEPFLTFVSDGTRLEKLEFDTEHHEKVRRPSFRTERSVKGSSKTNATVNIIYNPNHFLPLYFFFCPFFSMARCLSQWGKSLQERESE